MFDKNIKELSAQIDIDLNHLENCVSCLQNCVSCLKAQLDSLAKAVLQK